ncbi:anhydro-N-acetylmuramic acid kinase [Ornithinibacillus halotolerans]|uniref:Anhydro-N-acetylmuramic acid kinase n=1 Tax=Ornithinibacillus halotolerans TaxID=1274357 RepID=A0A916W518_9BACI|nr:anhydro-N-acetylmuramic acid kinase [Ornithinibacillus halotolerans]GGA66719.1 anhydro-N-acetylmuramic acid kinase [Ornithinibacillus halotolerans]
MHVDNDSCYAVGIMSGTSVDGIDIAVVRISEKKNKINLDLKYFDTIPYSTEVRQEILELCDPTKARIQMISNMNMLLGKLYGEAALKVIADAELLRQDIAFISSHGQTIFHQPDEMMIGGQRVTSTLQIGDISSIAEVTGITTVGDFRTRDMAAGGQGAPLVPYADYLLFRHPLFGRVLVNIGGISNLTILPANGDENQVKAYDTGPGNMIMDYFVKRITDGKQTYDKDGELAKNGKVDDDWLEELLNETYYTLKPPKTTGRELFGEEYARKLWENAERQSISFADRLATVTKLTAVTITDQIRIYLDSANIHEVYISGGGCYNPTLMNDIKNSLPAGVKLRKMDELGIPADAKEAMVFALLGYQYLNRRTNNFPPATGARHKVMMGKVAWGQ